MYLLHGKILNNASTSAKSDAFLEQITHVLLPALTIVPCTIKISFYTNCTRLSRVTVSSLLQTHRDAYGHFKPSLTPVGLLCLSGELVHNVCRSGVCDYKSCDKGDENRHTTTAIPTIQCIHVTEGNQYLYILLNVKNKQRCLSTKYIFIPNKTTEKVLHKEK